MTGGDVASNIQQPRAAIAESAMSTALHITLAEYDRLIKKGFFEQLRDRRIELIRGYAT
jgi:hypothetical protein